MSLVDIFIAIVDQTSPKARYERKSKTKTRGGESERELAKAIVAESAKSNAKSALFDDESESK